MSENGFFCVSKQSVRALLKRNVPADVFLSLLVLSKNSCEFNKHSFASASAIKNILGVNYKKALSYIDALLFVKKDDGSKIVSPPDAQTIKLRHGYSKSKIRWTLNPYYKDKLDDLCFFDNRIVGSVANCKNSPLRKLRNLAPDDVATRILFSMHTNFSFEINGLPPEPHFYDEYKLIETQSIDELRIIISKRSKQPIFAEDSSRWLAGLSKPLNDGAEVEKTNQIVTKLLRQLESHGFIQRAIMVFDGDPNQPDSKPLYELDLKGSPKHYLRISDRIEPIIRGLDIKAAHGDSPFRFYDTYAAIVPNEIDGHIVGIYRPKFIPQNSKLRQFKLLKTSESSRQNSAIELTRKP